MSPSMIGEDFTAGEHGEYVDTIGGMIFNTLGRVPARGEVVQAIPGFEFHVLDADPRRVKRVRIVTIRRPSAAAARRAPSRPCSAVLRRAVWIGSLRIAVLNPDGGGDSAGAGGAWSAWPGRIILLWGWRRLAWPPSWPARWPC